MSFLIASLLFYRFATGFIASLVDASASLLFERPGSAARTG
jgi:hypothetical protein